MFQVQKTNYNTIVLADFSALTTALGNSTFSGGEVLLFRFTTHAYATVNAGGTAITLATA